MFLFHCALAGLRAPTPDARYSEYSEQSEYTEHSDNSENFEFSAQYEYTEQYLCIEHCHHVSAEHSEYTGHCDRGSATGGALMMMRRATPLRSEPNNLSIS